MSKYAPLEAYLSRQPGAEVPMSFVDIERVVGFPLPEKASQNRAWWSNNPTNNVMTNAWLKAGFKTERVDMGARTLVFRRLRHADVAGVQEPVHRQNLGALDQVYGALRGTVRINVDLTISTGETWRAAAE